MIKKKKLKNSSVAIPRKNLYASLSEKINALSEEEKQALDTLVVSDLVYEAVLQQLNLPKDDELYRRIILGLLKRQTKDYLLMSIWSNLEEAQSRHLKDFINQSTLTMPWLNTDEVIFEFALMYPYLMAKVREGFCEFFKNFIKNFKEISEA